jgi:hypothetical protein
MAKLLQEYSGRNKHGGITANHDITYLRLASTIDGFTFKDLGILQGLNDPTTVSATGTRWLATAGSILKLKHGGYGLLFSGGSCLDGDSDAFHYIGYAESKDLIHWTVINDNRHTDRFGVPGHAFAGLKRSSGYRHQHHHPR